MVKNLPASTGDVGFIPGSGRSPGEGNGYHSSILVWGIPWTEEPAVLQSMGPQRVRHGWKTEHTHGGSLGNDVKLYTYTTGIRISWEI